MAATSSALSKFPSLRSISGWAITLPVIVIILGAVWLAGASVYENVRFVRATDQVLSILLAARDYAGREKGPGFQAGDDILTILARVGTLPDAGKEIVMIPMANNHIMGDFPDNEKALIVHMTDPWQGNVQVKAISSASMRMEMNLPTPDCRRMALFFLKNAESLGLQDAEAHGEDNATWQRFLSNEGGTLTSDSHLAESVCGNGLQSVLGLVFRLH